MLNNLGKKVGCEGYLAISIYQGHVNIIAYFAVGVYAISLHQRDSKHTSNNNGRGEMAEVS